MLEALRATGVPQLPADFRHQLELMWKSGSSPRRLGGRAKYLLRLYWILASFVCFYVSARVPWPTGVPLTSWVIIGLMGLAMLAAVIGVLRKPSNALILALRILG
jgi:hypothetical protein